MKRLRQKLGVLVVSLTGIMPTGGNRLHAQPQTAKNRSQAEELFLAGERAFKAGRHDVAAKALEAAYRATPLPEIAFSLAQAHRIQYFIDGHWYRLIRAQDLYRVYLKERPKGPRRADAAAFLSEITPMLLAQSPKSKKKRRAKPPKKERRDRHRIPRTELLITSLAPNASASIDGSGLEPLPLLRVVKPGRHTVRIQAEGHHPEQRRILAVAKRLVALDIALNLKHGEVHIEGPPEDTTIVVDHKTKGKLGPSRTFEVPPGSHHLVLLASGKHPWSQNIHIGPGQQVHVDAKLRSTPQRAFALVMLAASGASLVTGGAFAGLSVYSDSKASGLENKRQAEGLDTAELADYHRKLGRRNSQRNLAYIFGAVGAALGLTGAWLYLWDHPVNPSTRPELGQPQSPPKTRLFGVGSAGLGIAQDF